MECLFLFDHAVSLAWGQKAYGKDKTANCDEIQANTNNSDNLKCVAAVDNYNVNGSGAADANLDEIAVELV